MIIFALLLIAVAAYFLGKGKFIKGVFILFDAFFAFSIGAAISHLYISHSIAEGLWAILFLDTFFGIIAGRIYYSILLVIRRKFLLIWKTLNSIAYFFNVLILYRFFSIMLTQKPFLISLKNTVANIIFNLFLTALVSSYVYKEREDWFIKHECEDDISDCVVDESHENEIEK
jgi:hypothetical protein